jgi:polyisoprenoid-binding protein YceI
MKQLVLGAMALAMAGSALAGCTGEAPAPSATETPAETPATTGPIAPVATDVPAGAYTLDPTHATLTFTVNHLGFSNYTGAFDSFQAELTLDPKDPSTASLVATVDPKSLRIPAPPAGFLDELKGPQWLDVGAFPVMTFRSTKVTLTSPNTADVEGEFEMHGVKRTLVMKTTFNGGWAGIPPEPFARAGFSATTTLKRADFGIAYGVPTAGSPMGVSDDVQVTIETEFRGPAWADAPKTDAAPAAPPT